MSLLFSGAFFRATSAVALSVTLLSCVVEEGSSHHYYGSGGTSASPPPDGYGNVGGVPVADPGTGTTSPMLVVVDTNQVMEAAPGQGVGVFTTYAEGGKWRVWWTCDTALSQEPCDFVVSATAASGNLANVDDKELREGTVTNPNPSRVEARVTTSNEVHAVSFTSDPGAVITLEATVGGLREGPSLNGSLFFFVQDGQINGGYTGPLTNPLQLQGSTP